MNFTEKIENEFSFLNEKYNFEGPNYESWKNEEFYFLWKREEIKIVISVFLIYGFSSFYTLPEIHLEIPIRKIPAFFKEERISIEEILMKNFGLTNNDRQRFEKVLKIKSCSPKIRKKRKRVLENIFEERTNKLSRLVSKNLDEILNSIRVGE